MHRVICCYPDVDALVGTAAAAAGARLLLTYPQERPWTRLGVRLTNTWLRLVGSGFRTYVHPARRIAAAAAAKGLGHEEPNGADCSGSPQRSRARPIRTQLPSAQDAGVASE